MRENEFIEIIARTAKIESPTNLLFFFEKMALRDAVKRKAGAKIFVDSLYALQCGKFGA